MRIDLPKTFRYSKNDNDFAEVKNGILYLHGNITFRNVMHNITYCLKGNETCFYCGRTVKKKKITIDHLYSQNMGGPTIPNNLAPCCEKCNSEKSNLSYQQFKFFLRLTKKDRDSYRSLIAEQQETIRRKKEYDLPEKWVCYRSTKNFIVRVDMDKKYKGVKYKRIAAYYKEYGAIQKPIVVDKKGFVLDGYTTLMFAKEQGIKKLPVIVLENVIVKL